MNRLLPTTLLLVAGFGVMAQDQPPSPAPASAPVGGAAGQLGVRGPRLFLGVQVEDTGTFDGHPAIRITRVVPGATVDRLGAQAGDLITKVNGTVIVSSDDFGTAIAALKSGDPLTMTVSREGKEQELRGIIMAPPRPRDVLTDAERIGKEAAALRDSVERAQTKDRLEEMIRMLHEFEAGLPAAAADFKRLYPKGTFDFRVHIDIRSDATAPEQTPLSATIPAPPVDPPKPAAPGPGAVAPSPATAPSIGSSHP
jgi:hypothetical protein